MFGFATVGTMARVRRDEAVLTVLNTVSRLARFGPNNPLTRLSWNKCEELCNTALIPLLIALGHKLAERQNVNVVVDCSE